MIAAIIISAAYLALTMWISRRMFRGYHYQPPIEPPKQTRTPETDNFSGYFDGTEPAP